MAATAAPVLQPPVEPQVAEPQGARTTTEARTSRWPLYAAGLLAFLVVLALLVAHPWTDDSGAATEPGTNASPPAGDGKVRVRRADYIGEPVEEVVADLRRKGFKTTVKTKDNPGGEEVDLVADVSPSGDVEKGATLTVQAWGEAPAEEPGNGDNSGNGNDNGGGQTEPADPQTSDPADQPTENSRPGASESPKADKPVKTEKPGKADASAPAQENAQETVQGKVTPTDTPTDTPSPKGN